jgi:endonuclease/exonuclease/phosphatase family metal-dependent hydrolase
VLGGAAGLATVASPSGAFGGTVGSNAGASTTTQSTTAPTVLTQNAYLGVDLFRLFRAESADEFRRIAGELLAEVDPALYAARADAIAGAVAAAEADVVALQEAALLRTQRPGDFGTDDATPATSVLVDFLSLVESALADRDLDYEVAAVTTTTDVELPAETDDGQVDVRLTDRDVLLVRGDHAVDDGVAATFETALPIPLPESDRAVSLERGYCSAEVTVDGVAFTAVSTHLESVSPVARRRQARELLDALPDSRPVVVGGDFNSGPGTETDAYDRLTSEFSDAHATLASDDGYTCCQAGSLRNDRSRLDRRIDALLYRGPVRPTAVGRVGHRPEDRIEADVDGETVRIWPSDHAGVVGTFEVAETTPTPTPTATRTATATATPRSTSSPTATIARSPTPSSGSPTASSTPDTPVTTTDGAGPGMGVLATVGGLLAALAARARRE